MNIEDELFKGTHVDYKKLKNYGFVKENDIYKYSKIFFSDSFRTDIYVGSNGNVSGKVFDLQSDCEYINIRIKSNTGAFVNRVREEYKDILKDIRNNCFDIDYFISSQANRVSEYIINKYGDLPEFLWEKFAGYGVFRNKIKEKWYGVIMNIDISKIDNKKGFAEILNIKVDSEDIPKLLKQNGFYEGYHMNKKNWVSVILNDTLDDKKIYDLIDASYNLVNKKDTWIIPANPKYYDIINCFNNADIINWKQSSDIHNGDIVYIYVAAPYSCLFYKCEAINVNIPYKYKNKNLSINRAMEIKLLKKYSESTITFSKLNELGIKAIRGPRKVSMKISEILNNY